MHCLKAMIRSRLRQPDRLPERRQAPMLADWAVATVDRDQTLEEMPEDHSADEAARLCRAPRRLHIVRRCDCSKALASVSWRGKWEDMSGGNHV